MEDFGASLTGRYIKSVEEAEFDNKMGSRFYVDVQFRWQSPSFADNFGFALGINNLFDARQQIVDGSGDVPLRFQPYLVDPTGRFFEIEFRKLF